MKQLEMKSPPAHKASAAEVGMAGFEPATPWSQTRYTNRTVLHPAIKPFVWPNFSFARKNTPLIPESGRKVR